VALGFGWLNQAQLRYYSKDKYDESYQNDQLASLFFSTIFCITLILLVAIYKSLSIFISIILIITIFSIGSFNYIKTFYQAKLIPQKIIYLTSLQSIMSLIIPIPLMFIMGFKYSILILGIAFSFLFSTFIIIKIDKKKYFSFLKKNIVDRKNNNIVKWFKYGSPISIWFVIGLALPFLDRYFINYYLENQDLGTYSSLQEILVRSFSFTLFPFTMALHPRIMDLWNRSKIQQTLTLILNSIYIIIFIGLIILFIIWFFNDLVFILISKALPEISIQSKIIILPLLLAGFLWQLSLLTHKMLELKEKTTLMIVAIIPSLIINIIGNNYFLPKFGLIGTAYTGLASALVYCIITSVYFIYSFKKIQLVK